MLKANYTAQLVKTLLKQTPEKADFLWKGSTNSGPEISTLASYSYLYSPCSEDTSI